MIDFMAIHEKNLAGLQSVQEGVLLVHKGK